MFIDTVQKPVKMSFSIADLAKSSRDEKSDLGDAVIYNFNLSLTSNETQQDSTPVKLQALLPPLTSTPLSLPLAKPNNDRQTKRKREDDSVYSEDSSFDSSDSKSTDSITPTSDDAVDSDDQPRKKSRCIFTSIQVKELERCYSINKFLPIEERPVLAKQLGLSQQQVKTWFQNRRMKEKRQHKNSTQKMYYPNGPVDVSVAMGMPFPPVHMTGCQPAQLPGYTNQQQQFPGSPTAQVFDQMSYMFGYGSVSPIMYPSYNHFYNGLSPQPSQHYRM